MAKAKVKTKVKSFDKKSKKIVPPEKKRSFKVFVAIRHTRAGDVRLGVYDSEDTAMMIAEDAVNEAAAAYGFGSASVFRARLHLLGDAIQPK
jgi:hypothetical protein